MENISNVTNRSLTASKFSLNRNQLKYIAIIAMVIDHTASKFVPGLSLLWMIMRTFGRLTAPCMCFFIAEGFHYTRNKTKYGTRLALFAIASWIPFNYFETGQLPFSFAGGHFSCDIIHQTQSVIYTLFLCFIALCFLEAKLNIVLKIIAIACICVLDMHADWHVVAILMTLVFYLFRENRKKQALFYAIFVAGVVIYRNLQSGSFWRYNIILQSGMFLFVPLLLLYSGEKGSSNKFHKWFFYIFYPAHLLLLGVIRYILVK